MTDSISALRLFSRVARTESFTLAGKEFGLSQPSVSRIISKLEKDVGVALFVRSTHAVKLTDAGAEYLERIDPILVELEEANFAARGDGKLKGRLRVGCATSFAVREIIPKISGFLADHPDLKVDFILSDSMQDLIDQAIDVAIRFGALADSTNVARKIGETERLLVASPSYLEKAGIPKTPADLAGHKVVIGPSGMGAAGWNFEKNGKALSVRVEGQLTVSVNEAATACALASMGIITTSLWGCKSELESGQLVRLLPDWEIGFVEVNAVLPGAKTAKPSARAFTDYLMRLFKG